MSNVLERMRSDWNERARQDAHYYVAFGGRQQDDEAFLATGAEVVGAIEWELKRFPRSVPARACRALEIGCGPGRLMRPLSRHFGEIHGVDVSDEMIGLARQRLQDIPHAHVHATNGASLDRFADQSFDLVYSYAVFQHIPSRAVVFEYMREISRVLKPGGVFRGQFNGLPAAEQPDTWQGVSFTAKEIRDFTREQDLQLLALEGARTQYMWTTWRKPGLELRVPALRASIRRITNASSSETVAPNRGPLAAISVWAVQLPAVCDLNTLDVRVDGASGDVVYIGPAEPDGLRQINVMLPAGVRSGLVPVELRYAGTLLCAPQSVRTIPAGPLVPRILSITDGIDLVEEDRSTSGLLKVQLDEIRNPEGVSALVDGQPVREMRLLCTDPLPPRYELNFRLPEGVQPGRHELRIRLGSKALMPREIDVAIREAASSEAAVSQSGVVSADH